MSTNCATGLLIATWFMTIINAVLFISSLYFITIFIRHEIKKSANTNKHKQKKETPKLLLNSGLTFFIISSLILLLWHHSLLSICYSAENHIWRLITIGIGLLLYLIVQVYLLW
eukprot:165767_1